jgi:hypothetical protein
MPNRCIIGGGSGGGVLLGYWHERTSLFVGYVMEAQESPSHYIFLGETARPQIRLWQKIRVNPNYLVVFLLLSPLHVVYVADPVIIRSDLTCC